MIERAITSHLDKLAKSFRVVSIMGPRQSGKTTLAKHHFPNHTYVNLENIALRQLAKMDPVEFFHQYKCPIILDEIQRAPELLSTIQVMSDETKKNGQFILTGSHQPGLRTDISQSLAGRAAILELLPLSIAELERAGITMDRDDYIFKGFMPRIYDEHVAPELLYANYYRTYVERDVRQLINLSNQHAFEVFVKLLAGRVGQLVNLSSLSNDVGVSSVTLSSWLSVLEASYIVFRLPGYFNNFYPSRVTLPRRPLSMQAI
ncbi:MAG: AAA family ATPase [Kiritimatiellae bacterium]|nr:AAA family ATPase [Kiritimatiellia bacterium]